MTGTYVTVSAQSVNHVVNFFLHEFVKADGRWRSTVEAVGHLLSGWRTPALIHAELPRIAGTRFVCVESDDFSVTEIQHIVG
jgi:hypothetical protein